MPDRLAIYRLGTERWDVARQTELAQLIFDVRQDFELGQRGDRRILRSGDSVVEVGGSTSGIWAADEARLWNPSARAQLVSEEEAITTAQALLRSTNLVPPVDGSFRFGDPIAGGTYFAITRGGKRENRRLDVQVAIPILVDDLPIVGGGGDFTLTLGDGGAVIGFSGVWRPPMSSFDAAIVERERADEQFRALTKDLDLESFEASLAYYGAPAFTPQEFLFPVYVYRATARFGDQRVPLRNIIIAATEFGPPVQYGDRQPARPKLARRGSPEAEEKVRRSHASRAAFNPFEAGTSWIGLSGGLAGSQSNAQGFVDEWAAAGWNVNFNWGDGNAWESDWRRNDDTWVDNADFVFYTGHANMNGWVLAKPDDGFLDFAEVGANPQHPGDLWGQNDLEWVVIAACGPLQDEMLAAGGGNVFDRWAGAFDGLHLLMGYGGITFDNTDEGGRLAQYAKSGSRLIDAWFRTAKEIQPSTNGASAPDGPTVYVGAMWVGRDEIDPQRDHAWGHGSVSADPVAPTWFAAMWTMC